MTRDSLWRAQHRWAPYLFVSPFVVVFFTFTLYPLGWSLSLSLQKTLGPRHQSFVGLSNYRFLLAHDRVFWLATLNTTAYAFAYLILQIPMALGLAMLLNHRKVKFKSTFRFCFFSSYLVGHVFAAVIFQQIFSTSGAVNQSLSLFAGHPIQIGWLSNPLLAMPTVLIANLWLTTGYAMVYFLAALQAVDPELYEAAQVDGAGRWSKFFHITLPGLRPMLAYIVLIGTIGSFQLFELPYVLYQGAGPGGRALTLVMYLFITGFGSGDMGYASAIGWMLVVILLVLSLALVTLFGERREV
jgi:ABC-type sugar transport system permease subunit